MIGWGCAKMNDLLEYEMIYTLSVSYCYQIGNRAAPS